MAKNSNRFAWHNRWTRKRNKRLEQYLETESHEWTDAIERQLKERNEKERQIEMALHHERRDGSNWLENREMQLSKIMLEYEGSLIGSRVEIRKRLALECPTLLSDAELSKLEKSMLCSIQSARLARRGDYERRARTAGAPICRPNQRDASEYSGLEALVRREVRQLTLARNLGRVGKPAMRTQEDKSKFAAWVVPAVIALLTLLSNVIGLDRLRHWLGLGR